MVRETHAYGLPCLEENPFSIRPLEPGESGKLVGREDIFVRLQNFLRFRSARRVMLLGPLGSGRTSLVSCLKSYAASVATIDHLPAHSPATSLLSMCYRQMIGGEPPASRTELVTELVNEMYAYNDKLPMIVIDVPASDLSVLEVALRDAHSSLERLNALLILVCDVKERHHLPAAVVDGFDLIRLPPLTANDVMALVHQRLASVGVMDSAFTMQDAAAILDDCDGYPASVITILRDAVDSIRMGQSGEPPAPHLDTSARIFPRDEPHGLHRLMGQDGGESTVLGPDAERLPDAAMEANEGPTDGASAAPSSANASAPEDISEVIDASMPWNQRPPLSDSKGADEATFEPPEMAGFELDMNRLHEQQEQDEPLQPNPFNTPIIDADQALGPRTPVRGMFKGLASRNKDAKLATDQDKEVEQNNAKELIGSSREYEYWVDEALLPAKAPETIPEEESAMLLHDEVGLVEGHDDEPLDDAMLDSADAEHPVSDRAINDRDLLSVLAGLLGADGASTSSHHPGLLAFLQRRIRERAGPNESYALDKHLLGSLNASESYVVALAHQRAYSPSDEELLTHLSIKRARLSQISNRLLKHGILQARQVGRSRKYTLTQAARAQLVAWGAIAGGEGQ